MMGVRFESARRRVAATMLAATLASCGGGQLAGPDADRDGQLLAARPEMARLYLIQGYLTVGTTTHPSAEPIPGSATVYYYNTADLMGPTGVTLVTTLLAGPIAGIIAGTQAADDAERVDRPNREKRISLTYKFFVDDKYVGDIGSEQYMALDLPPGAYRIFFKQPAGTSSVLPLELKPGETEFFLANASRYMGAYWEKCGAEDCGPLVRDSHRVIADLAGRQENEGYYPSTPPEKAEAKAAVAR
jgi:hypothetical protein